MYVALQPIERFVTCYVHVRSAQRSLLLVLVHVNVHPVMLHVHTGALTICMECEVKFTMKFRDDACSFFVAKIEDS